MLNIFQCVLCAGWLFIGVLSTSNIPYYISTEKITWFEAVTGCQSMRGHLVTIPDQHTWNELSRQLRDKNLWIGGRTTNDNNWVWTENQTVVKNPDTLISFRSDGLQSVCAYVVPAIRSNPDDPDNLHIYNRKSCTDKLPYICKHKDKMIISVVHENMTWRVAKHQCEDKGMQLANFPEMEDVPTTLASPEERIKLLKSYEGSDNLTTGAYWIGLQHQGWRWIGSEEVVTFSIGMNLFKKELDNQCLLINNMNWTLAECNNTNHYICSIPEQGKSSSVKSSIKPKDIKWIIIGCVLGGSVLLIIIIVVAVFCCKRKGKGTVTPPTSETTIEKGHDPDDNVIVDNDLYSSN